MKLRRSVLWLHRWVGLLAGLVVLVLAVTGAVMVWEHEVDAFLNPTALRASISDERMSIDAIVANMREARPREGRFVAGMKLPDHPGDPLRMLVGGPQIVFIDAATGKELGSRPVRQGFVHHVTELHLKLKLGATGARIVGIATALTFGMALTGLWLWWPLRIVWFKGRPSFRRFNFDLHSVAGLYSSLFLLVVTMTGVTMSFPQTFDPWIRKLSGSAPPPRPPRVEPRPGSPRISLDSVVKGAEAALPGARVVSFGVPVQPRAPFRVQLRFPEDRTPGGRSLVFLDPYTGKALQVLGTRGTGAGNWYIHFSHSLHNGELFGLPSQVLALLVCVALVAQISSGFLMWWKPGKVSPAR